MDQKRVVEQTIETITSSPRWPSIQAIPYQYVARIMFVCGFAIGAVIAATLQGPDHYVAIGLWGLVVGGVVSGSVTTGYIVYATGKLYQQDRVLKTERFAPEPLPEIEPARITGGGHTAVISQPKAGAFAQWTRGVLDDTQARLQFSFNEATRRGFDYDNVIGELKRIGALEHRPDGNGVYRLSDAGRKVLTEWLK